jgi:C4-dicarboxylate-specific signal transduction histidine kinase
VLQLSIMAADLIFAYRLERSYSAQFASLIDLTILGLLLVVPVIAYARSLSNQIAAFDATLQAERDALEQRVQERTAELRTEIGERIRLEEFNRSENRILEMVAEGTLLADILSELALAVEAFVPPAAVSSPPPPSKPMRSLLPASSVRKSHP